jgi:hypothetical protein
MEAQQQTYQRNTRQLVHSSANSQGNFGGKKGLKAPPLQLLASSGVIQRYESPEHQDLGDKHLHELHTYLESNKGAEWAEKYGYDPKSLRNDIGNDQQVKGAKISLHAEQKFFPDDPRAKDYRNISLTPGEIISLMGDFYETWEELQNAPRSEIVKILGVMKQEKNHEIDEVGAAKGYIDATKERPEKKTYLGLAERNANHFAPRNAQTWQEHHQEAITTANQAYIEKDRQAYQQALLIDAAGSHFLTDAFASGHMFNRPQVMARIYLHLKSNPPIAANPQMQTYIGVIQASGKLDQLVLKNIHDHFNEIGLPAINKKGMSWKTYGDGNLEKAPETQRIASLAVFLSRQQINLAYQGQAVDPQEISDLIPDQESMQIATDQAILYIPEAVQGVESLIYRNRKMADTQFGPIAGGLIENNLDTIGGPQRGNNRDIFEDPAGSEKMGRVRPSFTLFRW